uniref:Uncharacterized protein n=1 Tax=Rhizophora mucronata TaxID=61149 RepID=A0A2P2NQY9_RHIMU
MTVNLSFFHSRFRSHGLIVMNLLSFVYLSFFHLHLRPNEPKKPNYAQPIKLRSLKPPNRQENTTLKPIEPQPQKVKEARYTANT